MAGEARSELAAAGHVAAQRGEGDGASDQRQPEEDQAIAEHGGGPAAGVP